MKCAYHPDITATVKCSQCNKFLCVQCAVPEGDGLSICTRCLALKAAGEQTQEVARRREGDESKRRLREASKKRRGRIWTASLWGVILICLYILAIQAPKLSGFKKLKPIRHGTYTTDTETDQCINNLWHISKQLQEGKLPDKEIVCPVSKKPYVLSAINNERVVLCPSPEIHGFKQILVRETRPIPELIK